MPVKKNTNSLLDNEEITNQIGSTDDENTDENVNEVSFEFLHRIIVGWFRQQEISLIDDDDQYQKHNQSQESINSGIEQRKLWIFKKTRADFS